jgi:hypothetical protein
MQDDTTQTTKQAGLSNLHKVAIGLEILGMILLYASGLAPDADVQSFCFETGTLILSIKAVLRAENIGNDFLKKFKAK